MRAFRHGLWNIPTKHLSKHHKDPAGRRARARLTADQPAGARSRTIRRLLVRASSRSIAAVRSVGGGSVVQRLPTLRTSPRRSRSSSRARALSLLRPAARATIAVENEAGILLSAGRSRSGRCSPRGGLATGAGSATTTGAGSDTAAGLCPTRGLSPKRARQLPHRTTGSRSGGRTTSKRRHPRPEWQTLQRRPARSISVRSSACILPHHRRSPSDVEP
jgi:hypothetical protein